MLWSWKPSFLLEFLVPRKIWGLWKGSPDASSPRTSLSLPKERKWWSYFGYFTGRLLQQISGAIAQFGYIQSSKLDTLNILIYILLKHRFPSKFAVDTFFHFGPGIQNSKVKIHSWLENFHFRPILPMWISEIAYKKSANFEDRLYYNRFVPASLRDLRLRWPEKYPSQPHHRLLTRLCEQETDWGLQPTKKQCIQWVCCCLQDILSNFK